MIIKKKRLLVVLVLRVNYTGNLNVKHAKLVKDRILLFDHYKVILAVSFIYFL
jgi:hypothetical protein